MASDTNAEDFALKSTRILVTGKDRTCHTTDMTFKPFIEVELGQLTAVHTIRAIGNTSHLRPPWTGCLVQSKFINGTP